MLRWDTRDDYLALLLLKITQAIREVLLPRYDAKTRKEYETPQFTVTPDPLDLDRFNVSILLPPFYENERIEDEFRRKLQELIGPYTLYRIA